MKINAAVIRIDVKKDKKTEIDDMMVSKDKHYAYASYCVQTADLLQEKSFKITRRDGDARRIIAS
ncbi:hypothetical protein [[Clostridium] innocuum]|uniref:hypothetical protein n=1 Tax=Clostridium innocuum TaxID=1522 RepID=UPI001F06E908|nr:hypothetical protein [[Clostridium] innocuum]MCH1947574.1 hypothetical protein [[Clostridium] innocuum]